MRRRPSVAGFGAPTGAVLLPNRAIKKKLRKTEQAGLRLSGMADGEHRHPFTELNELQQLDTQELDDIDTGKLYFSQFCEQI